MNPDVERIKQAFRRCQTIGEVNACAKRFSTEVQEMSEDPVLCVDAIHIKNLAKHMRVRILNGWGPVDA
jgi:hypothetical protein